MNVSLSLFLTCVWMLNNYYIATATEEEKGLFPAVILLNRGNSFDLVDIDSISSDQSYNFIILACQADDEEQSKLEVNSLTESSLVIENIFESPSKPSSYKICKKMYSPSVLEMNNMEQDKVTGYEFYLDDQQVERLSTILPNENIENIQSDEMSFIRMKKNWLFYMIVDTYAKPLRELGTTHLVSRKEYTGDFKYCQDFHLGETLITDEGFDKLFDKENQIRYLNKFVTQVELEANYLIKQQLTPIDDFDSHSKRLATCTFLNIAPMWKNIATGSWRNVENKIREVAKIVPLEVSTGTLGKLRLPLLSSLHQQFENVVLNGTPVPDIYWKLVSEKQSIIKNQEIVYRGIIIFTYNYIVGGETMSPLCSNSVCGELGWEVESDDFLKGYTYCCKPEKHILETLLVYNEGIKFVGFDLKNTIRVHEVGDNSFDEGKKLDQFFFGKNGDNMNI